AGFLLIAREPRGERWLTRPFQTPLSWSRTNDYAGVGRIANIAPVPVKIIHSARDGIIPFHHGMRLYEAAEQPKDFLR
ncbi:alpha/beta hydrolase, partial [Pantoea sp. SIMBA_133]